MNLCRWLIGLTAAALASTSIAFDRYSVVTYNLSWTYDITARGSFLASGYGGGTYMVDIDGSSRQILGPNGETMSPMVMNARGNCCVKTTATSVMYAVLNGIYYEIPRIGTETNMTVTGMNDRDEVCGFGYSPFGAFYWSPSTGRIPIGGPDWSANSINNAGQVVGSTSDRRAYLWTLADGVTILPSLPGAHTTGASAISSAGMIVGHTWYVTGGVGYSYPYTWTPETGAVSTGYYGAHQFDTLIPVTMTSSGLMGGFAQIDSTFPPYEQFIWNKDEGYAVLTDQVDGLGSFGVYSIVRIADNGWIAMRLRSAGPINTAAIFVPQGVAVQPSSLQVFRGAVFQGGLSEALAPDGTYLTVRPGFTISPSEQPVNLVFRGNSPTASAKHLRIELKSKVSGPGLKQYVDFYNYQTQTWEAQDARPLTTTDKTCQIAPPGDCSRFVHPSSLQVSVRVRCGAYAPVLGYPWSLRLDEVRWFVTP
jgi:hypothetical protein